MRSTIRAHLPHGVGKHVCHIELDGVYERDGVFVFLLCLSTEPSDEVRGQRYICVCVCVCVRVFEYSLYDCAFTTKKIRQYKPGMIDRILSTNSKYDSLEYLLGIHVYACVCVWVYICECE